MLLPTRSVGIQVGGGDLRIYNNTIHAIDTLNQSFGIYIQNGDSMHIVNNVLSGFGSQATGILFQDSIFPNTFRCDYNNFYYPNGVYSSIFTGSNFFNSTSLTQHQNFFKLDSNSWEFNPLFLSDSNVHIRNALLTGKGIHITDVTVDFDGDPRDPNKPTIGADVIQGSIDLKPDAFVSFTGNFYPGSTMEVEYRVKNVGELSLSSIPWKDKIYLSNDQTLDPGDAFLTEVTNNFAVDGR